MKVLRNVEELSPGPKVLCIGNFDGIHLGHQALLRTMASCAPNLEKVVLTFRPHPVEVLTPGRGFFKIQQWDEMPILLNEYNHIDTLVLQEFTREFTELRPEEFIVDWLIPNINPQFIVVGEDFNFGYGQAGDVRLLKSYEARSSFKMMTVPTVVHNGKKVSSTLIREFLSKGNVACAGQLLGRPYFLEGFCQPGKGRGREFGFPTFNIPLESNLSICPGVYICYLVDKDTGSRYPSVANVGRAPTLHKDREMILEVHMLGTVQEKATAIQRKVRVELIHFVRQEMKFPDEKSLIHQIKRDVEEAKDFFARF